MTKAENEPLVATIEIRGNTDHRHHLTCTCRDRDQHSGAPLLILVNGKWLGAASCDDPDHLGAAILRALDQHAIPLDFDPAGPTPGGATDGE